MARSSPNSAGATYLDKAERIESLRRAAGRAADRMPSIRRVVLFGSLVNGIPTPASDADLVIEVVESSRDEPRDRIPEALAAFRPLPCSLDLFVFTSAELRDLERAGSPVARTAREDGLVLFERR